MFFSTFFTTDGTSWSYRFVDSEVSEVRKKKVEGNRNDQRLCFYLTLVLNVTNAPIPKIISRGKEMRNIFFQYINVDVILMSCYTILLSLVEIFE